MNFERRFSIALLACLIGQSTIIERDDNRRLDVRDIFRFRQFLVSLLLHLHTYLHNF